jgi:hypothetical protein
MKKISKELEGVITQMLKPLKDLPLSVVIEGLSGYEVIEYDNVHEKDKKVLENLKKCAENVLETINKKGILRPRPNEVGNDIEIYVKNILNDLGYKADTPKTNSGNKKSTGYPDIVFKDEFGRTNYLECKTYNIKNIDITQRSFYLSPSNQFKVTEDAHHFGISFEIYEEYEKLYKVRSWKILDLSKLKLDVKYEFNADNKRLYDKEIVIAESRQ